MASATMPKYGWLGHASGPGPVFRQFTLPRIYSPAAARRPGGWRFQLFVSSAGPAGLRIAGRRADFTRFGLVASPPNAGRSVIGSDRNGVSLSVTAAVRILLQRAQIAVSSPIEFQYDLLTRALLLQRGRVISGQGTAVDLDLEEPRAGRD